METMNENQDWFEAHKEYEYMEEARELREEAEAKAKEQAQTP